MVSDSSASVTDPYPVKQPALASAEHDTLTEMMSTTTLTLSEIIDDPAVSHRSPHSTNHNAAALPQTRLKEAHGIAEHGCAFNFLLGLMCSVLNASS